MYVILCFLCPPPEKYVFQSLCRTEVKKSIYEITHIYLFGDGPFRFFQLLLSLTKKVVVEFSTTLNAVLLKDLCIQIRRLNMAPLQHSRMLVLQRVKHPLKICFGKEDGRKFSIMILYTYISLQILYLIKIPTKDPNAAGPKLDLDSGFISFSFSTGHLH